MSKFGKGEWHRLDGSKAEDHGAFNCETIPRDK